MPHLTFRGIKRTDLLTVSKEILDGLSDAIGCDRSHFTLALDEAFFVFDGEEATPDPFIEVAWFDRGQEVKDKVARLLTQGIQNLGYPEVSVWFVHLDKSSYYDNGAHYGS